MDNTPEQVFFPRLYAPTHSGRISQYFGENSETYTALGESLGVPLKWHNGIDFPGNEGALILAPFDGVVRKTGYDAVGYGYYVEVTIFDDKAKPWGWYLLAHAKEAFDLHVGAVVRRGDMLGIVGSTGNSTGPHVHLELVINDYYDKSYNLGALGRVNPLPFLHRPQSGAGSGIGSHWQTGIDYTIPINGKHLVVKILDGWQDTERLVQMMEALPTSIIILRNHPLSEQKTECFNDPAGTALAHVNYWLDATHDIPHHMRGRVLVEGINEPPIWLDGWPNVIDIYNSEAARLMMLHGRGVRWIGDNLSVGWGGDESDARMTRMALWFVVSGAALGRHDYWQNYEDGPANEHWWTWHWGRILRNPWPVAHFVTEAGPDYAPDHQSWKQMYNGDPQAYMSDLARADELLRYNNSRYCGMTPFTDAASIDWLNFDMAPLRGLIASYNETPRLWPESESVLPDEVIMLPIDPPLSAKTTVKNLRLRAGPTTAAEILAVLPKAHPLSVNGKNEGGDWLHVDAGDFGPGWVFGEYVEIIEHDDNFKSRVLEELDKINATLQSINDCCHNQNPDPDPDPDPEPQPPAEPEVWDSRQSPPIKRDWKWLQDNFGEITITPSKSNVTDVEIAHIARIDITEGPSTLVVHVQDKNGNPINNTAALMYWPDAPQHDSGCYDMHENKFVHEITNQNGDAGFGLGQGSYYWPPDGSGPHKVWLCWYRSDMISGIGMLYNTNHIGPLRITFVIDR